MRFATFQDKGKTGIAVSNGYEFHGLTEDHDDYPGDLDSLFAREADLAAVGQYLMAAPVVDLERMRLLPPLRKPGKILCIGLNYSDHAKETGAQLPEYPNVFARFPSSLIAHTDSIVKPVASDKVDYEAELVAVIGKGGRYIPREKALSHVAGYAVFNDVSIRDYQKRTTQWTVGKNFDGTGVFGPWIVTADELPPGAKGLKIRSILNGVVMQDASTSDMVFDVETLVTKLSETMTLDAGDIIVTGTPPGVGMARDPQVFMKSGDLCEIEIERVGLLRNPVFNEKPRA